MDRGILKLLSVTAALGLAACHLLLPDVVPGTVTADILPPWLAWLLDPRAQVMVWATVAAVSASPIGESRRVNRPAEVALFVASAVCVLVGAGAVTMAMLGVKPTLHQVAAAHGALMGIFCAAEGFRLRAARWELWLSRQ